MSADYFLDTNIIAYAFDKTAPAKKARALQLIEEAAPWHVSWQVVQEFTSVALHRFKVPLSVEFIRDFSELLLWPHCSVWPSPSIHARALEIHQTAQYRIDDSLIVAAALESGVSTLYTEDLQHGRQFDHLTIVNPFL